MEPEIVKVYKKGRRVKRKPVIRKTGALRLGMEQTPIAFNGGIVFIEEFRSLSTPIRISSFISAPAIIKDDDRVAHPLSNLTKEEKDLLETGLNINNSDIDLCEFEGKTYIFYANGAR